MCYPLPAVLVVSLLYSFYCMYVGNYNTATWNLPYLISVPFDESQVWGWYLKWLIECNLAGFYSFGMIMITSHFIGCCYYLDAICDHFDCVMASLNCDVQQIKLETKPIEYAKIYRRISEKLARAVRVHVKLYE